MDFLSLHKNDQRKLLARNAPLFVQFVLAKYLTSSSCQRQIQWLLLHQLPDKINWRLMHKMSMKRINHQLKLFKDPDARRIYKDFVKNISACPIKMEQLGIWIHVTLFQHDPQMGLVEPQKVHILCEKSMSACEDFIQLDYPRYIMDCECAAHFFSENVHWFLAENEEDMQSDTSLSSTDSKLLVTPLVRFTNEEGNWLERQMGYYDQGWNSINLGEDMVRECMKFSFDEPLSKKFMSQATKIILGRFLNVMKCHPEFKEAPVVKREALWKKNSILGLAIYAVKMESFNDGQGRAQFELFCSKSDWDYMTDLMKNLGPQKQFKQLTAHSDNNDFFHQSAIKKRYYQLIRKIAEFANTDEMWKLLILSVLFTDAQDIPSLAHLQSTYSMAVRRKYNQINHEYGNNLVGKLESSMSNVVELAGILTQFKQSMEEP